MKLSKLARLSTGEVQVLITMPPNPAFEATCAKNPRDTQVLEGARAGLARAGDRLNVTHFIVDGREIRECFDAVAREYQAYFEGAA